MYDANDETKSNSPHKSQGSNEVLETAKQYPANAENSTDALQKLMDTRHLHNEIYGDLEKVYSCGSCFKQMMLYDQFNDDIDRIDCDPNIELVDETVFQNQYKCLDCDVITCLQ